MEKEVEGGDEMEHNHEALLDQLMHDYASDLKRIAYLYVNDMAESEDIIQEVFITCYKNLSKFRHEASYKTWLIRITINKCKDYRKRWTFKNLIYKSEIRKVSHEQSIEEQHVHEEFSKEVIETIANLSWKYKEVLILFYYEEMTMKEISETLEVSINTVKSRLLRGKASLKERLERSGIGG